MNRLTKIKEEEANKDRAEGGQPCIVRDSFFLPTATCTDDNNADNVRVFDKYLKGDFVSL